MVLCRCRRCVELGGHRGLPINSSTARSHRQLYQSSTDAAVASASTSSSAEPACKQHRRQRAPTPTHQLIEEILSSRPSCHDQPLHNTTYIAQPSCHDQPLRNTTHIAQLDETLSVPEVGLMEEERDDAESQTSSIITDEEWPDEAGVDDELMDDKEEDLINADEASSIASRLFVRESSSMSSLELSPPQRNVDSWVWKTHVFVTFLLAFTALANDEATLVLSFIFAILGPLIPQDNPNHADSSTSGSRRKLVTPSSIARSLNMDDRFKKSLICIVCHKINDWDGIIPTNGSLKCTHCLAFTIFDRKPRLVYTHRTVEMILALILQDKTREEALDKANKQHGMEQGNSKQYGTIWSGEAWRQDCSLIDCNTPCREQHTPFVADSVLGLKLSLNVDWFHPFKGGHSGTHSIGVLLLRIDNMPERMSTLDRRCRGIHLVALFPGPTEASFPSFADSLHLVIDEIRHLDKHGVKICTALHPQGRTVRTRLNMVVADSPARAKTVGFSGNRHTGRICPYCPKHTDNFGTREAWEDGPRESWPAQSSTQSSALASNTLFSGLKYFDRQLNSPPDPMHAVYLGICRRFWHKLLIECCNSFRGRLKEAQKIVACALIPSRVKRPDPRIGAPGGGMPTAEERVTLFRCLLPFVMLDLWGDSLMHNAGEALFFEPTNLTTTKELLRGSKPVTSIFELGMLLCCIVDMLEGDFSEDDVLLLHSYILCYNSKAKDLLGCGWLVFNNHITEHIPDAIRRFGAPRSFSCLPFERYNGILGRINTLGHKQGQLELTMMRKTVNRLDLWHLLAQSSDYFFRTTLLGYIRSRSEEEDLPPPTRLAKTEMESDTYRLLLTHLNGLGKSFHGRFVVPHDISASLGDVILRKDAVFLRTVVKDVYPSEVRVAGQAGQQHRRKGNNFGTAALPDQMTVAVHILWIFEKQVQINGPGTVPTAEQYMHVRMLWMLTNRDTFSCEAPHAELLDKMGITFARLDEVGEELVLPLDALVSQLAVVPFCTHNPQLPQVYSLKRL